MEYLGYMLAVLIGVSLGMMGSGGSILTVPVLVYLMGMNPLLATTSSLFIVGATSLTGAIRAYTRNQVDFKAVSEFGIPSIFSIFITRHFILPAIPENLFRIGNLLITRDIFLMLFFAILMLAAAISMMRNIESNNGKEEKSITNHQEVFPLAVLGLIIGFVTGLLGAGGGFLIIPALVLFLKLPMKKAVGTSLLIIAINSTFGFLFSLKQFEFNWTLLIIFTLLAMTGIFIGSKLAERISAPALKKGFGWFVLVMALYIIIREIVFN